MENDCPDSFNVAIEVGYAIGAFHDEILKDGIDSFFVRDTRMDLVANPSPFLLDSLIERYVEYHQMDFNIVHDFFLYALGT